MKLISQYLFSGISNFEIENGVIFHSDRGVQYACNKINNLFFDNTKTTQKYK
jgi:hypothetical protein